MDAAQVALIGSGRTILGAVLGAAIAGVVAFRVTN